MPSGLVLILELKTRNVNRAFPSDVIQLSAQRLALERRSREVVAHHGYVVAQPPDGAPEAHRVQSVSGEAVVALVRRREAILAGRINPTPAPSVGVCRTCTYRFICPDRLDEERPARHFEAAVCALVSLKAGAKMQLWPIVV